MRSWVNFTSLAVKGWPSCHFTPRLSLMTYSRPFALMPPLRDDGTSVARLGLNCARSSTRHRLSKMPKCTPWSTSMCGRTGLKTVGSCDSATTTCPPFLTLSAASTTLRSSRGPRATAAPAPPRRPSAVLRERTMVRALVSEGAVVCFGVGVIGVPSWRDYAGGGWACQGNPALGEAPHARPFPNGEDDTPPHPDPLPIEERGIHPLALLSPPRG